MVSKGRTVSAERASTVLSIQGAPASASEPSGLWGRAFRPFFLGLAIHAALVVPWWVFASLGRLPAPAWPTPMAWHGHEMVFGFVAAAIAGFLLTASPVWSGGPALTGRPLAALVALWALGRLSFAAAGALPPAWVAAVDVAFLPGVALALLRTLRGSGQTRNFALVGIVAALAVANAVVHAEALGLVAGVAGRALRFAVDLVVVLILVITGRITPAFTRNALRRRGVELAIRSPRWLGALAIGAAGALAVVTPIVGRTPATGALAVLAGLAAAVRLAGWRPARVRSDPLLWSLHAGSAWVAAGLLLVGASDLGAAVPATAGLHALTAGAMGSTILAVVTRVGLGHTGRPLELPRGVVWSYVLVHAAAVARVAVPFAPGGAARALLVASGLAWAAAFAIFAIRYAPILTRPRPDGRPG
jgi:uncharacterized protein involved in response to NO